MKTRFFPFLALSAIAFSACFSGQEQKESENRQDTAATSTPIVQTVANNVFFDVKEEVGPTFKQGQEETRPLYTVRIDLNFDNCPDETIEPMKNGLCHIFNGKAEQNLNEAVMAFGDSICNAYRTSILELYSDTTAKLDFAYEFLYQAEGSITKDNREDIVPYKIKITTYEGGAHGGYYEIWSNFDRNTGTPITLSQVFDMDKEEQIKEVIRQQICKNNNCKDLEELHEATGILILGDVFLSDNNFQLCKDGIEMLYNPYDIAPWAAGTIYVKIPYKSFEGLLK